MPQVWHPQFSEDAAHAKRVQSQFRKHTSRVTYAVYGLVVSAMIFGLVQVLRAISVDLYNLSILTNSQAVIQGFYNETVSERQLLRKKIRIYSSRAGIEELARNHLDMIGPGEILVKFRP